MSRRPKDERYPGVSGYRDRHGRRRWRYRGGGASVELGRAYGSAEFQERYEAARAGHKPGRGAGADRTAPGSLSALIAHYYRSPEFTRLAPSTKETYRGVLEPLRAKHGTKRVASLETRHVRALLAQKADTPAAANALRGMLGILMRLAVGLGWRRDNPVREAPRYATKPGGYHTWTEAEITQYLAVHPPGTTAHAAMTIMLYSGAAKVDAVALGPDNVVGGRLRYRRQKTARRSEVVIDIPVHPALRAVLDDLPEGITTFLQTQDGQPRSPGALGNQMRKWCDAAGLPHCTSHGLRKAIARRLAEAGATPHEIAAVTGHASLSEVQRYTAAVDRPRLADEAFGKLLRL